MTLLTGSTRRVTFRIPTPVEVTTPTAYRVSLAGTTADGIAFASGNKASLTVNPPARISSISPNNGGPGQSYSVTLTTQYTNFVQGSTQASFGPGISVNGAAEGAYGTVTVTSPTSAVAQVTLSPSAAAGFRTVTIKTGVQQASQSEGFSVVISNAAPVLGPLSPPAVNEGATLEVAISATDPDGDALVLTVSPLPGFARFTDHGNGSGTLSLSPDFTQAGEYPLTVTATDAKGASASGAMVARVNNSNRPPVLLPVGDRSVAEGNPLSFQVEGQRPRRRIPHPGRRPGGEHAPLCGQGRGL